MPDTGRSRHHRAAAAFASQARERFGEALESIVLYGSVARGEERGVHSDVDLLVVLRDSDDKAALEEQIRALAYDVELDFGVVLSLVVKSAAEYEQEKERPFFRQVTREAETLYG